MSFEFDREDDRRRAAAGIVKLRVGLALVDDARHTGRFETDQERLAARVEEILTTLGAAGWNPDAVSIEVIPIDADSLTLSTPSGQGGTDSVTLRSDGVLLAEYTTMGVSFGEIEELSPEEQERLEAAQAKWLEQTQAETFQGRRFLRALACEPLPCAEVQLLAVELFDDGLVVHHTFEQTQEEFERDIHQDPFSESAGSLHWLQVEDDLGTQYRRGGGGEGSVGVVRSSWQFTPAVPEGARILRISTPSSTVEVPL